MRFSLYEILQLIVLFVEDEYVKDIYGTGFCSKPKVVYFFRALRKTCTRYCDERFDRIGENAVVEIDETVISKRKYNMGRIVNSHWLFECIERATDNFFLRVIDNMSKPVLESMIRDCIIEDSVNHSQNFVDPVTRAHTQSIESLWSRLSKAASQK